MVPILPDSAQAHQNQDSLLTSVEMRSGICYRQMLKHPAAKVPSALKALIVALYDLLKPLQRAWMIIRRMALASGDENRFNRIQYTTDAAFISQNCSDAL
jgi:hypothetical protein